MAVGTLVPKCFSHASAQMLSITYTSARYGIVLGAVYYGSLHLKVVMAGAYLSLHVMD